MKIGVYPGSFDPFTNGHLHVLKEASRLFDLIYVEIAVNEDKKRKTDKIAMKEAIEKVLVRENIQNVKVEIYEGLTMNFAREKNAEFIIRGLRNGTDYAYEENLAIVNNKIAGIETIYFRAGKTAHISSSTAMELYNYGEDISKLVPQEVIEILR